MMSQPLPPPMGRPLPAFALSTLLLGMFLIQPLQAQLTAAFTVDVDSAAVPFSVQFFDQSTPQDSIILREWDLDGDGDADSQERNPRWIYEIPGRYTITLIVADSSGRDTARYTDFIEVAPVEESEVACRIQVVEYNVPIAKYVELWGYQGSGIPAPVAPVSLRMPLDSNGCACFYKGKFLNVLSQNITDLLVLDENFRVIGKVGFSYALKDFAAQRRKDAIVIVHRDLVSYQNHPLEQAQIAQWLYPRKVRFPYLEGQSLAPLAASGDDVTGDLYQTTLLIPPQAVDSGAAGYTQYRLDNLRTDRIPFVLLHDIGVTDPAWGANEDIITAFDTLAADFNGKRDYPYTSYTGRLQRYDRVHADRFDVWEYYYPPDQNWMESGYLFARDLNMLLQMYDTSTAAIAAHGMGGLVLRSYLEGRAQNWTSMVVGTAPIPYRGDIYKTVFLGTPHAGRLRAGLAYAAPDDLPLPGVMDRRAPALRALMPGNSVLLQLNPDLLPAGVDVLNIAGSAPAVSPPLPVESEQHDDGRTALSSALLAAPRTANAVLAAYSARALANPDDPDGNLAAPDPDLIPELLYAFALSDTTLAPYIPRFLSYNPPDSLYFGQDVYQPPFALPLHTDVGIPLAQFRVPPGVPWPNDGRFRMRFDLQSTPRLLLEPLTTYEQLADAGLYWYPATVLFTQDPVSQQVGYGATGFFPFSRAGTDHPFRSGMLQLSGLGWQLPVQQQTVLPDPVLARRDDRGRVFDLARGAGDLRLGWSREKRNVFHLTAHEILLLDTHHPLRATPADPQALISVTTDCLTQALSVVLDYSGGSEAALSLMTPSAGLIDASMANDTTMFYTHSTTLRMKALTVMNPAPGEWLVLLDGVSSLSPGLRVATIADAPHDLHIAVTPLHPLSGDTVTAMLRLDDGPPLTQQTATLQLVDSADTRSAIPLNDDGIPPDSVSGDGMFSGTFIAPRAGSYRLEATYAALSDSCPVLRTASLLLDLPPSLELLSPQGGEVWRSGTVHNVRWQGKRPAQIAIDFSTDGGAGWTQIAGPLPASDGEWGWTVPAVTSEHCRLRVRDADNAAPADATRTDFTVYEDPVITLLAPNGGETWQVDTEQEIRWHVIAVNSIDLAYSTNNGRHWLPITNNIPPAMGSWLWRIPPTPSDSCLVRAVSRSNPAVNDLSDAVFRLTPIPAVALTAPNGGERWQVGTVQSIRWQSAAVDSVRIAFSDDGGGTWDALAVVAAKEGDWTWTVPDRVSDRCFIRVTAVGAPQLSDISNAVFSITPEPYLTLLSPAGGERWEIGTSQTIRWASAGITAVDIEYSTNNGQFWITAAVNIDAAPGRYYWMVPDAPSEQCLMRISDTYDSTRMAITPRPFIISESLTRPTLYAPVNRSEGVSTRTRFRWLPFAGAERYHLQVSDDTLLSNLVIDEHSVTTSSYQSPELSRETRYWWRVKAIRGDASESQWSVVWEFRTSGTDLAAPMHLLPHDGAIGLSRGVQFTWEEADNADAYHLQIASDEQFSQLLVNDMGLTGLTYSISGLDYEADYWWRVRSGNTGATAFSDWSRPWKFSTAPAPPRQLTPFDGLPDVPLHPLLAWYPVPGARAYRLQVALDDQFDAQDIVFDSSGISGTTVQLRGLWSFWHYWWRLNVTSSRGTSDWNEPWRFRTVDIGTAVEDAQVHPSSLTLHTLWPQPVRDALTVAFSVSSAMDIEAVLYDLLGRCVRVFARERAAGGTVLRVLDVSDLDPGTYVLRLHSVKARVERLVVIR
ncbi:MAG: hypothetical protein JXA28_02190 [Bacteroidetes bacterium]|nr:hypothetical protein [Bacteroidota bacterium]